MKSQGASTAGEEPVEGDGTPPTPLGRVDAGTGGVSRGPPPGLAAVKAVPASESRFLWLFTA